MPNAIIYTRQSKHRDESITHENQEDACRKYAASKGYDVVEVVNEKGKSGRTIDKRTEFRRTLKLIEDGHAEIMLVWRWSRFARNTLDGLITLKSVEEEAGGKVESALEPIDRSAMGKFQLTILLAMAELESEQKSEDWKSYLNSRLDSGTAPAGRNYFGYRRVMDATGKKHVGYEIVPEQAEAIREAAKRVVAGHSLRKVAFWLNEQGFRTTQGKPFVSIQVRRVLLQPFVRGKIGWKGKEVDGAHEAILSEGTYRKVAAELSDNTMPRRSEVPSSRLRGIVECAKCGRKLSYQRGHNKDRPKAPSRFRCPTRVSKGTSICDFGSVLAEEVGNALAWAAQRRWNDVEKAVPQQDVQQKLDDKRAQVDSLQHQITQMLLTAQAAGLSTEQVQEALTTLREQSETAQTELSELEAAALTQARPWHEIEDVIHGDDVGAANATIKQFVRRIVADAETLSIEFVEGLPYVWYLGSGPSPGAKDRFKDYADKQGLTPPIPEP
ncbi:recombinase family protein [Zhihengliuella halotolerans]|uniref:Recombinase-like zinc beta ribbon protein n=1 Tax=Zhihengliuella halotolerans TaxID=370736 RepID=A0A4V2G9R9_9MICC|nr:recombinase family protein [Zhihengliuella halotolerans]RZU61436.1 recombinase-like zinc beta ribbon protein [Zhihengliuella halotolerans]